MSDYTIDSAYEGAQVDMVPSTIISRNVEDSTAIGYGLPVKQGTKDNGITSGIATGDFVGITVRNAAKESYAQYDDAALMAEGAIWLKAAGTISAGDSIMYATGWKKTSGTTGIALSEAVAETSATSGGLFKLRIWGTNAATAA